MSTDDPRWREELDRVIGLEVGNQGWVSLWSEARFKASTSTEKILSFLQQFEAYKTVGGEKWPRNAETILLNYAANNLSKKEPLIRLAALLMKASTYNYDITKRKSDIQETLATLPVRNSIRREIKKILATGLVPGSIFNERQMYEKALGVCIRVIAEGVPIKHWDRIPGLQGRAYDPR